MTIGSVSSAPSPEYSAALLKKATEAEARVAVELIQSAVQTAPPPQGLSIVA